MNTVRTGILVACCLAIVLPGCSVLRPDFEQPTVTISSFRPVFGNSALPSFEIGLRVVNTGAAPLKLRGVSYTVNLAGRKLVTGAGKDLPVIEGYSEGTFTLTASASLLEGLRLFNDLINESADDIPYEVETKLDVGTFMPPIRVRESGRLSLTPEKSP